MRLAFYVSGAATRLRKILADGHADVIASIRLVVSDSQGTRDLAPELRGRNIRFVEIDYAALGLEARIRSESLSRLLLDAFRKDAIDYCFCFGDHILRGELLAAYAGRIINFHPSILPLYPGRRAIDRAVAAGEQFLGNTAHFVTNRLDAGPIILQSKIAIGAFERGGYDAVLDMQIPMLYQIFEQLSTGRLGYPSSTEAIRDDSRTPGSRYIEDPTSDHGKNV